jgi:hypothetical protein
MLNAVKQHSMHGDDTATNSILDALDAVWDNYERTLKEEGSKSDMISLLMLLCFPGWDCLDRRMVLLPRKLHISFSQRQHPI